MLVNTKNIGPRFTNPPEENTIEKILPTEIIFQIFSKLNNTDLYNISLTTRSWNDYATVLLKKIEIQNVKVIINFFINNLDHEFHNNQINRLKTLLNEIILHTNTCNLLETKQLVHSIKRPLLDILNTIDQDFLKTVKEKFIQNLQIHPFYSNIFELLEISHVLKAEFKNINKENEDHCKRIAAQNTIFQIAHKKPLSSIIEFILICKDPAYLENLMFGTCYFDYFNNDFPLIKKMLHEFCKKMPDVKKTTTKFLEMLERNEAIDRC